jgi:hypothetical protein
MILFGNSHRPANLRRSYILKFLLHASIKFALKRKRVFINFEQFGAWADELTPNINATYSAPLDDGIVL